MKIFGHINDLSTGESMPYVNIAREGTSIGTTTNNSGFFTLEGDNLDPNWEFTISHIGYTTLKRRASNMQGNSIYMNPSSTAINEVVISGSKYEPKKTTSWIEGLRAGLGLNVENPNTTEAPTITVGNPGLPIGTPFQPQARQPEKTNPLIWIGLGVGVLAILVTVIIVSKNNR
tara:strand:- start:484 stop:1005 length:522 start_codon:yes stop_codon:yes gene_type:complete